MNQELPQDQAADPGPGVTNLEERVVNPDPERLQRTVQRYLGGFHAGLLDTGFMAFDDSVLAMTMSG